MWCVVVCDLETSRMGAPYIYIYDISSLRFNLRMQVSYNTFIISSGRHRLVVRRLPTVMQADHRFRLSMNAYSSLSQLVYMGYDVFYSNQYSGWRSVVARR